LRKHRYLAGWHIRHTSDGADFKIIFYHGDKFTSDQLTRIDQTAKFSVRLTDGAGNKRAVSNPERSLDRGLLYQLMRRGISEKTSAELLRNLRPGQEVMDQLAWGDYLLKSVPRGKFYNSAGILITLIKENAIPPDTFESTRKRKLREAAEEARDQQSRELARLELPTSNTKTSSSKHSSRNTARVKSWRLWSRPRSRRCSSKTGGRDCSPSTTIP
jgi:hypothetical protein